MLKGDYCMKDMSELFKEICQYKEWDSKKNIEYDSNLALLRKKYRFLMNRIVMRDSLAYETSTSHYINDEDVIIVKKLLIMAVKGRGEDKVCKKWFNGSLKGNNYKDRAELYLFLEKYLTDLYDKNRISEITFVRWKSAFDSSLCGNTSIQILNLYSRIDKLVSSTIGLNYNINFDNVFMKNSKGELEDLFPKATPEDEEDVSRLTIERIASFARFQEDYFLALNSITEYMTYESYEKTCNLIIFLLFQMKEMGHHIDTNLNMENLACEGYSLMEQLYVFLLNNPTASFDISEKVNMKRDDILKCFKFFKRDNT